MEPQDYREDTLGMASDRDLPPLPTAEPELLSAFHEHQTRTSSTLSFHTREVDVGITAETAQEDTVGDGLSREGSPANMNGLHVPARTSSLSHIFFSADESVNDVTGSGDSYPSENCSFPLLISEQEQHDATNNNTSLPNARSQSSMFQAMGRPIRPVFNSESSATPFGYSPLRSPSPNQARRSQYATHPNERIEAAVPRWQPDAEATFCPICRSQFNFFVRKHHCRKCGRVVCNSCSPHRITIPYQYIVRPLSENGLSTATARACTTPFGGSPTEVESLGGGERVRLCNPCVPDPNITPPPSELHHRVSQNSPLNWSTSTAMSSSSTGSDHSHVRDAFGSISANHPRHHWQPMVGENLSRVSRSNTSSHAASYTHRESRGSRPETHESRSRSNTIGAPAEFTLGQFSNVANPSTANDYLRNYRSLLSPADQSRPLPRLPSPSRPQISEEDECWVCHEELPSRSLDGYELLRATHVKACIDAAVERVSGARREETVATVPETLMLQPPENRHGDSSNSARSLVIGSAQLGTQSRNPALSPGRRTGVFPYRATEKDCVDDAECTICLEEFEVGVEMGRLECFCRFHLRCIRGWFETRPGQCPVHQHGGFY